MARLILSQSIRTSLRRIFVETIGLQSARGRLLFFGGVTLTILFIPYQWLSNLSLWQALGVPSPSIGLTRAYWKLIHGDPVGAFQRNPLILAVIAIGVPLLIADGIRLLQRYKVDVSQKHQP